MASPKSNLGKGLMTGLQTGGYTYLKYQTPAALYSSQTVPMSAYSSVPPLVPANPALSSTALTSAHKLATTVVKNKALFSSLGAGLAVGMVTVLPQLMKILKAPKLHGGERAFMSSYSKFLVQAVEEEEEFAPEVAMARARMENPNEGSDSINDALGAMNLHHHIPNTMGSGVPTSYVFTGSALTRDEVVNSVTLLGMQRLVEKGEFSEELANEELKKIHPPLLEPENRKNLLTGYHPQWFPIIRKPISFAEEVTRYRPQFTRRDLIESGGTDIVYDPNWEREGGNPYGEHNQVKVRGRLPSENELKREISMLEHLVHPDRYDNDPWTGMGPDFDDPKLYQSLYPNGFNDLKNKLKALKHLNKELFPVTGDLPEGDWRLYNSLLPSHSLNYRKPANVGSLRRSGIVFASGVGSSQLYNIQNLASNDSLLSQYENEFNQALREAGREDIYFDKNELQNIFSSSLRFGGNYSEEQRAGIMTNKLNNVFFTGNLDDDSRTLIRPETINRLVNENPRLKEIMVKFKNEVTKPIPEEVMSDSFKGQAGITSAPKPALPNQEVVTKAITEFATKEGPRSTGLLGAGAVPQDNPVDKFYKDYANDPVAMRIFAEESAKYGRPYANPSSPWYDPERAARTEPTYYTLAMGAGAARKRLSSQGIAASVPSVTPSKKVFRPTGTATFVPPQEPSTPQRQQQPAPVVQQRMTPQPSAPQKSIKQLRLLEGDDSYSYTPEERKRVDEANRARRIKAEDEYY